MDHLLALRAFVRIAEAGSFAKAADRMNLPRSSVSKLVQDLEAHLGTKLLERTTRAVTITQDGAAYHERALAVLADIDEMDSMAASARIAPRGRLRVDVGSSLANLVLIPALPSFQEKYPDIDLQFGISDRQVDLIGEGVDCVIRAGQLADTSLVARKLCELDWVTCAAPAYLEGRALPATPADLEGDHRIVGYFSAATGRTMPLRYTRGDEQIEITPKSGIAVNESTAHLNSLLCGLGVGQTYGFMTRRHFESGALVELLPDWRPRGNVLHLVYPASRFPSPKLRAFADWAAAVFAPCNARPY
ncbi:LysR family transcriptional regulator [Radicibacter daui]|uniref:LysR family transcriptional regulator n=1 Tax=Radicibacter daui TaxID=3064829 RepID=UPI004046BE50